MKRKLSIVRRKHNRGVITACLIVIPTVFLYIWFGPSSRAMLVCFAAILATAFGVYFRWLWRYDARLCEEVGLLCPYCSRPLYQGGANEFTLVGKCPSCKRFVAELEAEVNASDA
ncbi:hypothetical protein ACXR0O_24910 [Verrucomicrobiota bacterium sgz303538]